MQADGGLGKKMTHDRYRVVERLEAGGMAEVFRGEAVSVQGFKKSIAIKRVLPHLAQNKNFIAMFLDEARLGARLNHANIVQVFDIGAADNTYFIVMEFIDGGNLRSVMESLRKQGRTVPLKEAVWICMEACRGLSYAHESFDEAGNPLEIVHRDISPPNIMLSRRGEVKLTDFGLAKATTQLEKTDPGVVKGKYSYLSPEAASGLGVDARADIFSLGIVLWEMLTGRRLFQGDNDYQTVKLVQQANIPSLVGSHVEIDPDFEAVLMKSLAREPAQRYASARDFGDALADYLFSHQLKVTSYDIANLVKDTIRVRRKKKDQSIIENLIQEELADFTSIDDMDDPLKPGSAPLDLMSVSGAQPLNLGSFEDPKNWFVDTNAGQPASGTLPVKQGWTERGRDNTEELSTLLEGEDTGLKQQHSPAPAKAPSAQPEAKSGSKTWLWVTLLLLLALGGAAAWLFLGGGMQMIAPK